jgi:hypothetical protein
VHTALRPLGLAPVSSTLAVGQLRVGDKEILLETGDARDPVIAGVAANATAKGVHQKMVDCIRRWSMSWAKPACRGTCLGSRRIEEAVQLTDKRVQSMATVHDSFRER